jgi:SEC-C motif-containing protein
VLSKRSRGSTLRLSPISLRSQSDQLDSIRGTMPRMTTCLCGSGAAEAQCCGPILDGEAASTALALMRSRYVAYVRGAVDHVVDTHDPASRATLDRDAIARWSRDTRWLGLEIVATQRGGDLDQDGVVEFIARGVTRGAPFMQRERSRFRRIAGRWHYIDGAAVRAPVAAAPAATPGRNDPCPCGSGMKYKRCHGA